MEMRTVNWKLLTICFLLPTELRESQFPTQHGAKNKWKTMHLADQSGINYQKKVKMTMYKLYCSVAFSGLETLDWLYSYVEESFPDELSNTQKPELQMNVSIYNPRGNKTTRRCCVKGNNW